MLAALALSFAQFGDARVLRLLARSLAVTLLILAALASAGWWLIDRWLRGLAGDSLLSGALALAAMVVAAWLIWRLVAFAVLQFYADDVVAAIEARHYPAAAAAARPLGWRAELRRSLASGGRAAAWNLAALPVALLLLVTGVGTPLLFWAVNAVLLGRELTDMVRLRHRAAGTLRPLSSAERLTVGGIVSALTFVPVLNLLAPFLGAGLATHLIHRKAGVPDAA